MTDHDELRALVAKWRNESVKHPHSGFHAYHNCADELAAALAAQEAKPAGGEGVVVPRVPTPVMVKAAAAAFLIEGGSVGEDVAAVYTAMLAAAPQPAKVEGWRPIESAPLHEPILMLMKHGAIQGRWDGEVGSGYYWQHMEWYASHWMPLPEPPAAAPQPGDGEGES